MDRADVRWQVEWQKKYVRPGQGRLRNFSPGFALRCTGPMRWLGSMVMMETPLDRAIAKRDEIELELRKCPDFQLYLITKSRRQRARMEQLLMEIPNFKLWYRLAMSVARAQRRLALSMQSAADRVRPGNRRTLPVTLAITWAPATESGSQ